MYDPYSHYINDNIDNIIDQPFKSNPNYTYILEHVDQAKGIEYLELIYSEFPTISLDQIIEYIKLNDRYGSPNKAIFTKGDIEFHASPSSIRYIYHALVILKHYFSHGNKPMVEIGGGYGGLFLAICFFSKILNIKISKYYIIDLPCIGKLIQKYLEMHKNDIQIEYSVIESNNYGKDIQETNLFLISNYCFTEVEAEHRERYITHLFPKISNGFIIWQTVFGLNLEYSKTLVKVIDQMEEKPQTGTDTPHKNYFIFF